MNPRIDRRSFLKHSTSLVVLASAGGLQAATEVDKPFAIIDTHQHLWDLGQFTLPWLKKQDKLNKSYLMEDYRKATADLKVAGKRARVVKTVYMEVDVAPEQQQAEADYVLAICKKGDTQMVAAVVSGRPASEGFAKYVKPLRDHPAVRNGF